MTDLQTSQCISQRANEALNPVAKPENDPDLVIEIKNTLDSGVSLEAGNVFYNDPSIQSIIGMVSDIQRIIINRYFTNLLYIYRANSNIPVLDPITCLIEDSTHDVWLEMFKKGVVPFLASNNVYGIQ